LLGLSLTTVITTDVSVAPAFVPTRESSTGTAGPLPLWCRLSAEWGDSWAAVTQQGL